MSDEQRMAAELSALRAEVAELRNTLDLLVGAAVSTGGSSFLNTMLILRLAHGRAIGEEDAALFAQTAQESFGRLLTEWRLRRGGRDAGSKGEDESGLGDWLSSSFKTIKGDS